MKVIRCLQKTGAANHIGRDAAWLITTIASLEDTKRYSGPVAFWNPHLMDVTGFSSKGTFVKARARAVESGWLVYREGRKGHAATYWTNIPDNVMQFLGSDVLDIAGPNPDQQSDGNRTGKRTATGPHSYLCPLPESGGASLPRTPKEKFAKPTADEVRAYAIERGQTNFDAEKFIDYYESNGWRVGKSCMKDWKATVRNWIRTGGTRPAAGASDDGDAAGERVHKICKRVWSPDAKNRDEVKAAIGDDIAFAAAAKIGFSKMADDWKHDRIVRDAFHRHLSEQRAKQ
ncbi:MAG: hypothetical protein WKF77_15870 [Planctomycetaceae bacterium]